MKDSSQATALVAEYQQSLALHSEFASSLASLFETLLAVADIRVHSITWRAKDPQSLLRKLQSNPGKYADLSDITDLAGVRIITYFPDEVDRVATLVQDQFVVDKNLSIDKRELLDPDRFGYLSLHYILAHSESRRSLAEYRRFADCRAELQLRSILQHTWAEIEHDLGYKTAQTIPREIKRRFAQLAGLLELADDQFVALRDGIMNYENLVRQKLAHQAAEIRIDQASLAVFIEETAEIAAVHAFLIEHGGRVEPRASTGFLDFLVQGLARLDIITIQDLRSSLQVHSDAVPRFMHSMYPAQAFEGRTFDPGAPLLYLCYAVAIERVGPDGLEDWYKAMNPGESTAKVDVLVRCYNQAAGG